MTTSREESRSWRTKNSGLYRYPHVGHETPEIFFLLRTAIYKALHRDRHEEKQVG